jgi:hypothetical protein
LRFCSLLGNAKFASLLPGLVLSDLSLQDLSGIVMQDVDTPVSRHAVQAWRTPMKELSGEQVRPLVSQKMGLKWLAAPAMQFVRQSPDAAMTFYPGDFSMAVLRAFPEILAFQPTEARTLAQVDFGFLISLKAEIDPDNEDETKALVASVTELSRGQA